MIRNAGPADLDAVHRLICELEDDLLPKDGFAAIFREQLADERHCCLVCELQGEVVGLLNLRFEAQLHHAARVAEILEFVVAPGRRGQGVGAELLCRAEALARERGCALLEVASNRRRSDAHRFYLQRGFEENHRKFVKPL